MLAAARTLPALLRCCETSTHYPAKRASTLSTAAYDPAIRQFITKLAEHQPCYSMRSADVHIMHEPRSFYQCLLHMIRRARHRVVLSSLYIGSEDHELIDTMHASLRENPSLHIYIHLDFNRSTRPEPNSTARLLLPLLQEHPDRVHVSLFRSPKLKGIMAKLIPPRFNEGWGTWHPKIYGADDEVLISGANLNTSYFTNRQDRYIHLTAQPQLAEYCFEFLKCATTFSYSLLPAPSAPEEYYLHWPDQHTHPHHIEEKAQKALTAFQDAQRSNDSCQGPSTPDHDVLVFPIIQAGQFNIREEERCLELLFGELTRNALSAPGRPLVDLTSGYFGLYDLYQDLILQSHIDCRILAASPKANGFYGSKGMSGRIPEGYTLLEQRFMRAVRTAGREWVHGVHGGSGVDLSEWGKDGWTYHAKGIWLRTAPDAPPLLTLFGSTNLNSRSANIDTELSFVLATTAPELRTRLAEEVDALREHALPWRGGERRVRVGTRILVGAVGGML
ncbi:CDP-diacylglycerol-glycerol-3-phosphate 3-phosphatidyltransferase [Amylocystis lapponica]|nr:CDP-diacylglycerol-glycerol-3-phosphate 3-phosphatidyltransferase [Amylocystis lapponica]